MIVASSWRLSARIPPPACQRWEMQVPRERCRPQATGPKCCPARRCRPSDKAPIFIEFDRHERGCHAGRRRSNRCSHCRRLCHLCGGARMGRASNAGFATESAHDAAPNRAHVYLRLASAARAVDRGWRTRPCCSSGSAKRITPGPRVQSYRPHVRGFGRTLFTYAVASARGLSGPGLPEVFTLDSSTIIK